MLTEKQIFIGEIKLRSPFGFKSKYSFNQLFDIANQNADWLSIHTSEPWGGSFYHIQLARSKTDKIILAKGIHSTNEDIHDALYFGADYVLVVDRIPPEKCIYKCLLEFSDFGQFKRAAKKYPNAKFVCNFRDLKTGKFKDINPIVEWRAKFPNVWLCQASGIESLSDVFSRADAFIVGTCLPEFVKELND